MHLENLGERTLFSVETINDRRIRAHSYYGLEDEIRLLSGTQLEIQSHLNPTFNLHIINLKQITTTEMLLELSFASILNSHQTMIYLFETIEIP